MIETCRGIKAEAFHMPLKEEDRSYSQST